MTEEKTSDTRIPVPLITLNVKGANVSPQDEKLSSLSLTLSEFPSL